MNQITHILETTNLMTCNDFRWHTENKLKTMNMSITLYNVCKSLTIGLFESLSTPMIIVSEYIGITPF